jgi:hypothetical protein
MAAPFHISEDHLPVGLTVPFNEQNNPDFIILKNNIDGFIKKIEEFKSHGYIIARIIGKEKQNVFASSIAKYLITQVPGYGYINTPNMINDFQKYILETYKDRYTLFQPNKQLAKAKANAEGAANAATSAAYSGPEGFMSEAEKQEYLDEIRIEKKAINLAITEINKLPSLPPTNDYGEKMLLSSPDPKIQALGLDIQQRRRYYKDKLTEKQILEQKQKELEKEEEDMLAHFGKMSFGGKQSTRKRKTRKHSKKSRSHRKSSKKTMRKRSSKRRNSKRSTRRRN